MTNNQSIKIVKFKIKLLWIKFLKEKDKAKNKLIIVNIMNIYIIFL